MVATQSQAYRLKGSQLEEKLLQIVETVKVSTSDKGEVVGGKVARGRVSQHGV